MKIILCLLFLSFHSFGADDFDYVTPPAPHPILPDPYIEFNSFEGSYSTNSRYKTVTGMHICVDKNNQLSGSYDEIGLLAGFVEAVLGENEGDPNRLVATGEFFEAGNSTCVRGEFQFILTSWGFNGSFVCDGSSGVFPIQEVRRSAFRPSDDQCALLDRISPLAIEGSWETESGYPLDACLTDTEASMSYLRLPLGGNFDDTLIAGYVRGTQFLFGKVVAGTWYEESSAGPILLFVRNTGELQAFRWTGLLGSEGRTVIDLSQSRQEEKHQVMTWEVYTGETTGSECFRFEPIRGYLLANLPEDDEDFYFFINSDYFDAAVEPQYYLEEIELSSDSSRLIMGSFSFLVTLLFSLLF